MVDALGLASVRRELMDSNTLDIVSAGLHWSFRMSRQIWPELLTVMCIAQSASDVRNSAIDVCIRESERKK